MKVRHILLFYGLLLLLLPASVHAWKLPVNEMEVYLYDHLWWIMMIIGGLIIGFTHTFIDYLFGIRVRKIVARNLAINIIFWGGIVAQYYRSILVSHMFNLNDIMFALLVIIIKTILTLKSVQQYSALILTLVYIMTFALMYFMIYPLLDTVFILHIEGFISTTLVNWYGGRYGNF
jgi:hypothetical protein